MLDCSKQSSKLLVSNMVDPITILEISILFVNVFFLILIVLKLVLNYYEQHIINMNRINFELDILPGKSEV